jgi:hypothetical protein
MRQLIILMIAASAIRCWASMSLEDCAREYNPDKKRFCLAVATLNATDCEKIKNLEMRSQCIKNIRDDSRAVTWKIQPLNDKNTTRK